MINLNRADTPKLNTPQKHWIIEYLKKISNLKITLEF
jgi:hypothetical protein